MNNNNKKKKQKRSMLRVDEEMITPFFFRSPILTATQASRKKERTALNGLSYRVLSISA